MRVEFCVLLKPFNRSSPDLLEPHILRSLSNVKAASIHTSSSGCHTIVLDIDGRAYLFGRNERSALGVVKEEVISENAPEVLTAADLGAAEGTKFVNAACGRSHSLLVGSDGCVWSVGKNDLGQVCDFQIEPWCVRLA
jgi:alpha-tubulin suppressor-like RCC1 family protein